MSTTETPNESLPPQRIKLDVLGVTLPGVGRWGSRRIRLKNILEMQIFKTSTFEDPHDHSCELCLILKEPLDFFNEFSRVQIIPYSHFPDAQADLDAIAAAIAKL